MRFPNLIKKLKSPNEPKAESSCIEMVKCHFPLSMSPLSPIQRSSMPEKIAVAHHIYFGEKQKSGACDQSMFYLSEGQPRELVSISSHLESLQNQHSLKAWNSLIAWFNWEKAHNLKLHSQEGGRGVQHISVFWLFRVLIGSWHTFMLYDFSLLLKSQRICNAIDTRGREKITSFWRNQQTSLRNFMHIPWKISSPSGFRMLLNLS